MWYRGLDMVVGGGGGRRWKVKIMKVSGLVFHRLVESEMYPSPKHPQENLSVAKIQKKI